MVHHRVDVSYHDPSTIQYSPILGSTSRGIGLEMTRQLLQTPTNTVFATCRSPSVATDLSALASSPGTLHIIELDVADEASIKAGTDEVLRLLNGTGLDYVLNNAAIVSLVSHFVMVVCIASELTSLPRPERAEPWGRFGVQLRNRPTSPTRSPSMSPALPSSRGISFRRSKSQAGRSS
ncbi:hypothetical protein J3R83DRAFT_13215 [Lanmaoa asiatica]|nr:hypothetical protein J3R83DRAFT_13215 [Lanmaoa asiatica]